MQDNHSRRRPVRCSAALETPSRRPDRAAPRSLAVRQRPYAPEDRSEAGHWEGDLMVGRARGSVIGTLVEWRTRTIRLLHLASRDADTLHAAVISRMSDLPAELVRSITWIKALRWPATGASPPT
jgi:transposase, IS30 family